MPPFSAKAVLLALACLGAGLLACVWLYLRWVYFEHRLTEVEPGRVFHSAAMKPETLVRFVQQHGIDTVLDLRGEPGEWPLVERERATLAAAGIRHIHLPSTQHPTREVITEFVALMRAERDAGHRVLFHCHHGEGRAVFFGAVHRVAFDGLSGAEAHARTHRLPRSLGFLTRVSPGLTRLGDRNPKTGILRQLPGGLAIAESKP